jgi:hypothetical protein
MYDWSHFAKVNRIQYAVARLHIRLDYARLQLTASNFSRGQHVTISDSKTCRMAVVWLWKVLSRQSYIMFFGSIIPNECGVYSVEKSALLHS